MKELRDGFKKNSPNTICKICMILKSKYLNISFKYNQKFFFRFYFIIKFSLFKQKIN